ncbi:MAG: NTP transferase domain-containing protein [Phycisphaeraceae bacterium]|nr:NTP transferase domain-containing protein [Phycisphaeraceae bacterium]
MTDENTRIDAIIMAAGKGTRMGGDLPKVIHEVAGKPMVYWVVKACKEAGAQRCILVIGYKGELVREALAGEDGVEFVEQTEQLGTAHAVQMAEPAFDGQPIGDLFVLAGDGPLIRAQTLSRLVEVHRRTNAAATLATSVIEDPTGYGRIVRDADGTFDAIVEQKDATDAQLAIQEVNPSYYCFDGQKMFKTIDQISANNAQGEYYITDAPGILKGTGQTVTVVDAVPPEDVLSINNPDQLATVDLILRERLGMPTPGAQA